MSSFQEILEEAISSRNFDRKMILSADVLEAAENVNTSNIITNDDKVIADFKRNVRRQIIDKKRLYIPDLECETDIIRLLNGRIRINYEEFKKLSESCSDMAKPFFSAKIFLKFQRDESGFIIVADFLRSVHQTITVESTMLDLACYAQTSNGCIEELELERFIYEYIPDLLALANVHFSMYPFYTHTAVKRFMFSLDPHRTRRIGIRKLAHSKSMSDFLELRTNKEVPQSNWFSYANVRQIYSQYLELDSSRKGMLSKSDVLRYTGLPKGPHNLQLTQAIVDRMFEIYIPYEPTEMDYKTFLDLGLALEDRKSPLYIKVGYTLLLSHLNSPVGPLVTLAGLSKYPIVY